MQSHRQLLHTWQRQLRTRLPGVRATRSSNLALLVLGLLWAGCVSLPKSAATIPLLACDASIERRLRRWLANTAVVVGELWTPLLPALLACKAGRDLVVVFDPPPQHATASVLVLGLVDHRRVLPVAWRVLPQQDPRWPEPQNVILTAMISEVDAALPPGCTVTLVADRGITSPGVIDACDEVGWHDVRRINTGPTQKHRVRTEAGSETRLWDLVTGRGQRWTQLLQLTQNRDGDRRIAARSSFPFRSQPVFPLASIRPDPVAHQLGRREIERLRQGDLRLTS